jgi:hypothetical protein
MCAIQVYWGRQSGNWEGSVTATSNTVTLSGRCGALGPQALNRAVMTGLEPGTTYYYKFGDVSAHNLSSLCSYTVHLYPHCLVSSRGLVKCPHDWLGWT